DYIITFSHCKVNIYIYFMEDKIMSIMVKDVNGTEQAVASNGKANAGLTLGIIGTALGALGSSVLGGIVGTEAVNGCLVTEKQFYENELASRDREFANFQNLQLQICNL